LRNVSEKKVLEKIETFVLRLIIFFNCAVYEITWKNTVARLAVDDNMTHAHFTLNTSGYKHALAECTILLAFLLQQWLHKRASVLRYVCMACLAPRNKNCPFDVQTHFNVVLPPRTFFCFNVGTFL
jgi:hypothetical protein